MKDTEFFGRKFSIDWAHFRYLWDNNASEYEYYEMAKPYLNFEDFDKGWQYRTVNNENFKVAKVEFLCILIQWY